MRLTERRSIAFIIFVVFIIIIIPLSQFFHINFFIYFALDISGCAVYLIYNRYIHKQIMIKINEGVEYYKI